MWMRVGGSLRVCGLEKKTVEDFMESGKETRKEREVGDL